MGKRTAQKDITIDTTSDSQVNSNFPNKWSPASLTFNNYFYLFLYLYITWISTNNNAPHLKSPKNQKQKSPLGTASNKNYWGAWTSLWSTNPRPLFCLSSSDITITKKVSHYKTRPNHSKTLNIYFYLFSCFYYYIKHDRQQSGKLYRWPQC